MEHFEKYFLAAVKFLSYRPRSEKEVRDKMVEKNASSEIIEEVVRLLKEQRFLNDEDFAKWWVEQRTKFHPKSKRVLSLELRRKGISPTLAEEVVQGDEEVPVND